MMQIQSIALPTAARSEPALELAPTMTAAAAARVCELVQAKGQATLKLRVTVSGGGCSGFQYGFEFDEEQAEDDFVLQRDGATLLVDPLSLPFLEGAQVDFEDSLKGAQFVVRNPNATATCGCGTSFTA